MKRRDFVGECVGIRVHRKISKWLRHVKHTSEERMTRRVHKSDDHDRNIESVLALGQWTE